MFNIKIKKEFKIGVVVVSAMVLLIWGFNFLKGKDVFKTQQTYYAIYTQVNGLLPSNPVYINGLKVGLVKDIFLHPDNSGRIVIQMNLNSKYNFPENSVARIINSDIIGSKAVELKLGKSKELAKPGDTLNSDIQLSLKEELNLQVIPLKRKTEDLLISLDSVLIVMRDIFNENTKENLRATFDNIKVLSKNLTHISFNVDTLIAAQRNRLSVIMNNVESISLNLRNNNQKISNVINNFSNISDSLAKANISKTISNANATLIQTSEIVSKINNGQGSLGLLLNNDSIYKKLNSATKGLDLLLEDMRLHPKRYVHFSLFGKIDKRNSYKAPEKEEKK